MAANPVLWPELPLDAWQETYDTLHMWTQIVGKIRKTLTPLINHWWNVTLYVCARGLTTSPIPYGSRIFEMRFDFISHKLVIETSDGARKSLDLEPRSVADFYRELMATLGSLGIDVKIHTTPDEVPNPIPFEQDHAHKRSGVSRRTAKTDRAPKKFSRRSIIWMRPELRWRTISLRSIARATWRTRAWFRGRPSTTRPGSLKLTSSA